MPETSSELERLRAALKVCEEALHSTRVIRDDLDERGETLVYAGQQASGAWWTDWQPGQQERDDAGTEQS